MADHDTPDAEAVALFVVAGQAGFDDGQPQQLGGVVGAEATTVVAGDGWSADFDECPEHAAVTVDATASTRSRCTGLVHDIPGP